MNIDTAYRNLADAIVVQAADDYRDALSTLKKDDKDYIAMKTKIEVEVFFRSDWFKFLTNIDGEYLLRRLRNDIKV